jgi:hypothetical protein
MKTHYLIALTCLSFALSLTSCKVEMNPDTSNSIDGTLELGTQIADIMASIHEMGKTPGVIQTMASCYGTGFGACAGNAITRTYGSCTNGTAVFDGSTGLSWGGTSVACVMQNPGDFISRSPNYTTTGRTGFISVFKDATRGEKLTWTSGAATKVFSYSSDGIRKTISMNSIIYYDITTSTASNLTVTGQNRAGRVINGGTLKILNNVNGSACTISPQSVTWADANCTCGSTGSWQGTCADGTLLRLDLTDCGHGQMTVGNYSESIAMDRCQNN